MGKLRSSRLAQGGGAVARGGKFGQSSGEGASLGMAPVHHVTIHDHRHDQVVEVDIPQDRCCSCIQGIGRLSVQKSFDVTYAKH